jgi:superfamily II DNA or RNA helicase
MERLLEVDEAAAKLRISASMLNKSRVSGDGPPFIKIGARVLYDDYQLDAVEQIEAAIAAGQSPLYVAPTGSGKTVVAAEVIERAEKAGKRLLVLTHRREILRQTSLKLPMSHGVIQSGLTLDLAYPVQIASVQTLHARCMTRNKIPLPAADLIIVDEAHHVRAKTWTGILEAYPDAPVIGLTATPCRGDGRGLGMAASYTSSPTTTPAAKTCTSFSTTTSEQSPQPSQESSRLEPHG